LLGGNEVNQQSKRNKSMTQVHIKCYTVLMKNHLGIFRD
jgi:hypothetical protein